MKHTSPFSVGLVICYLSPDHKTWRKDRRHWRCCHQVTNQIICFNQQFQCVSGGTVLKQHSSKKTHRKFNHSSVVKSEVVRGFRRRRGPSASASPSQRARTMHSALFCLCLSSFSTSSRASMNINCVPGTHQTPAERLEWVI